MRREFGADESVDWVSGAVLRKGGPAHWQKRPLLLILRTLGDPAADDIPLRIIQRLRRLQGRHHLVLIVRSYAFPKFTLLRPPRKEHFLQILVPHIEAEMCFAFVFI